MDLINLLITVIPEQEYIQIVTRRNYVRNEVAPDEFKPLLELLYDQIFNLITDHCFGLRNLVDDSKSIEDLIINNNIYDRTKTSAIKNDVINDASNDINIRFRRQFPSIEAYFLDDNKANLDNYLIGFELYFSEQIFFFSTSNMKVEDKLSLYKLTWAVDAFNKIKSSIMLGEDVFIIFNNTHLQIEAIIRPIKELTLEKWNLGFYSSSPNYHEASQSSLLILTAYSRDSLSTQYVSKGNLLSYKTIKLKFEFPMYNVFFLLGPDQ